jgi:3-phenylpropionate/trans-cinnamate dioxygenase ferredoxin component
MDNNRFDLSAYQFYTIGKPSDIPDGERLYLDVNDIPLVVLNVSGELFAIKDICTHDEGPLSEGELEGYEIVCPRHGAHFDIRTGAALTAPAFVDNEVFPVIVDGDEVKLGLPK